jgi:hypothetical protein
MGQTARNIRAGFLGSLTLTLVMLPVSFVLAGPASAKSCTKNIAPPGHAGSTEYYETVPTSCGNASPPSGGTSGSGGSINRLGHGKAGVHGLSRLGPNGKAAAALAAATAPPVVGSSTPSKATAGGSGLPWTGGGSAAGALGSALTGSSGVLGVLLPILMGLALVGAVVAGVIRARRSSGPSI